MILSSGNLDDVRPGPNIALTIKVYPTVTLAPLDSNTPNVYNDNSFENYIPAPAKFNVGLVSKNVLKAYSPSYHGSSTVLSFLTTTL